MLLKRVEAMKVPQFSQAHFVSYVSKAPEQCFIASEKSVQRQ